MRLTLSATGPAEPDVVWRRYLRPGLWAGWSPQIRGVSYAHDELVAGSGGTVHGPAGVSVGFTVTAVDPRARTWAWQVRVPLLPSTISLEHGVEAARGPGTRTWLRLRGAAPLVACYAPLAQWALSRLVAGGDD